MNRAYLTAEIGRVGALLQRSTPPEAPPLPGEPVPALVVLQRVFHLSPFERDVLVICAGAALDPGFRAHLPGGRPTFGHALAVLPDGHLDASSPVAPLRAYRLVTLEGADPLSAPLGLDERILYFLVGVPAIDHRMLPLRIPSATEDSPLAASHLVLAQRLARHLRATEGGTVVQLFGGHATTRRAIVRHAAAATGANAMVLRASGLATTPAELDHVVRACEREALLTGTVCVLELDALDAPETARAVRAFVETTRTTVILSAADPIAVARTSAQLEVRATTAAERRELWIHALGPEADRLSPLVDRLAQQFRLEHAEIAGVAQACDRGAPEAALEGQLWSACRERARPRLDDVARRIEPVATWNDLVVPPAVAAMLREICDHLRHRHQVHERWGLARGDSRGQAVTALFHGPSGTGKTLAAEVIAREARLDLYHVDLSQVVDKYVGETEKRLRRIFDAAEQGGAVLLFDEADALFGKRGEIERGTDRWANLEVSYLLQRMETYHGLAILTTNAKDALDTAFLRRLRFVAPFPFPDAPLRTELWRRVFPPDLPTAGIEHGKLARLQLTGANIKGVALKAAFHAAADASPVTMEHVLRAARSEFAKLEKPFPEAEVRAWGMAATATQR